MFVCFYLCISYHINVYIMLCYNTFNLLIAFYSLKFLYKNLLIHVLKTLRLNNLANKQTNKQNKKMFRIKMTFTKQTQKTVYSIHSFIQLWNFKTFTNKQILVIIIMLKICKTKYFYKYYIYNIICLN